MIFDALYERNDVSHLELLPRMAKLDSVLEPVAANWVSGGKCFLCGKEVFSKSSYGLII